MSNINELSKKIDEIYKLLMDRERQEATYRERLDNHLRNHAMVTSFAGWTLGSGGFIALVLMIVKQWG